MVDFDDKDIPIYLIAYSTLTVLAVVFSPGTVPESVKISILVSGQTALGGAAGMARTNQAKNKIDNVEYFDQIENTPPESTDNHFTSSNDNEPYK